MDNKLVSRKKILELEKLLLETEDEKVIDNGRDNEL